VGYLVVPTEKKAFAELCLEHFRGLVRAFGKKLRGRNKKMRITVLTFGEVTKQERSADAWVKRNKQNRPLKCVFFPRN